MVLSRDSPAGYEKVSGRGFAFIRTSNYGNTHREYYRCDVKGCGISIDRAGKAPGGKNLNKKFLGEKINKDHDTCESKYGMRLFGSYAALVQGKYGLPECEPGKHAYADCPACGDRSDNRI